MNEATGHIHLGAAIRTMRLAAGHSLREVARRVGVSPAYLSGVERESLPTPTHERLRDLAAALGVPARRLTALSDRLSPDLIEYLESTPEAVRFLRLARMAGLEGADFVEMAGRLAPEEAPRSDTAPATAVRPLGAFLRPGRVWCRVRAATKRELLESLTRRLLRVAPGVDVEEAVAAVLAREAELSTGVGGGVALAHADAPGLHEPRLGCCSLAGPLEYNAIDDLPVRMLFLVVGDPESRLRILARIAQLCVRPGLLERLERARTARTLHRTLMKADSRAD